MVESSDEAATEAEMEKKKEEEKNGKEQEQDVPFRPLSPGTRQALEYLFVRGARKIEWTKN